MTYVLTEDDIAVGDVVSTQLEKMWGWYLVGGILSMIFGFFVITYRHPTVYAVVVGAGRVPSECTVWPPSAIPLWVLRLPPDRSKRDADPNVCGRFSWTLVAPFDAGSATLSSTTVTDLSACWIA